MVALAGTLRGRLHQLRDVSQAFSRAHDLEAVYRTLHQQIPELLPAETFFLALYDDASRTIEIVRQSDFGSELPGGSFPMGEGLTSQVIRSGRSRLIRHWSREAPPVQLQYRSSTPGLPESAVVVPLVYGDQVLGVIAVHSYQPDAFDEDDLLVLEAISGQASVAIAGLRQSERLNTQLEERIAELRAVFSTMADALLMVDTEGRLITLNHAARELLCIDDVSIVLGQPLERQEWGNWPLGAREIAETLAPIISAVQRGEVPLESEVYVQRGGRRVLSFKGTPLTNSRGALTGSVLIVRDVTKHREIEELKDEILSIASHDLRTPVTVIKGQAQLLRREIRNGATTLGNVDDGLASIVEQTDRLAKLVHLLLDLSRIESGRLTLDKSLVDLGSIASSVVANERLTTDKHDLRLHCSGHALGDWDESRLHQVMLNLLSNAIKYSPQGGPIDVSIRTSADRVTVCVRDHGVGIAADEAPHVFERFFRSKSTHRLEGDGLGLYICKSIVAAHGGRIWVESAGPGHGSAFRFLLPRRETLPATQQPIS
jgi:signal transduction histidine kinase